MGCFRAGREDSISYVSRIPLGPSHLPPLEVAILLYTILHVTWTMRLVQTAVGEEEYQLLRQRAAAEGKSMKEVAREALRAHLLPDTVNPKDPVFHAFPLIRAKGKTTWTSRDHDKFLYRRSR
jgi:hypothetical protein